MQILAPHQFENVNILLSTICAGLISAVIYLFLDNKRLSKDHKNDLKFFDTENKKLNKELLDILNNLHLSIEEGKLSDVDIAKRIDRMIALLEQLKDKQ